MIALEVGLLDKIQYLPGSQQQTIRSCALVHGPPRVAFCFSLLNLVSPGCRKHGGGFYFLLSLWVYDIVNKYCLGIMEENPNPQAIIPE